MVLSPVEALKELLLESVRTNVALIPGTLFLVGPPYPFSTTDESASAALVSFAKLTLPSVGMLSERDKDRLLTKNPDMLLPIIVYELATGTGRGRWEFDVWSSVFQRYNQDHVKDELWPGFIKGLWDKNISYEEFYRDYKRDNNNSDKRIRINLPFSPDQGTSLTESFRRHKTAAHNWVQLLIAGALAFVYPAQDGWADIVIHGDVSRTSLLLHLGKSYDRKTYELLTYHIPALATVEIRLTVQFLVDRDYFQKK